MTPSAGPPTSRSWAWALALILLLALRVPSLAQPAGGDQFLYSYVAQRVLDGGVPYRDAFEQKTPGIFGVYAAMWDLWPHESVVAAADLVAAALVAWLLVVLGPPHVRRPGRCRRRGAVLCCWATPESSGRAASTFAAQCETFVALARRGRDRCGVDVRAAGPPG